MCSVIAISKPSPTYYDRETYIYIGQCELRYKQSESLIRSSNFSDFLSKCLTKDPASRPPASDLLAHPFIASSTDNRPLRVLYQVCQLISITCLDSMCGLSCLG